LPPRLGKQEVAQPDQRRLRCKRRLCGGRPSTAVLVPLPLTPWTMCSLPNDGLYEVESLGLAQRLQSHLRHRQVSSQVGELSGKPGVQVQPFTAQRAQQEHRRAMPFPVATQVAYQVEGGPIYPVQVI